MSVCKTCLKLNNGTGLICSTCGANFHHACVDCHSPSKNWICSPCSLLGLPFNQLASDYEFINAITKHHCNIDYDRLRSLSFNPLDISDYDDDLNQFNCSYYLNDSFNQLSKETNSSFSVFHLNGCSVSKRFSTISDYISTLNHKFSVYGFSETRFKETPLPLVHMNDYSLVHTPRTHRGGGGVAMFVSDDLHYKPRKDLQFAGDSYESIFVEISCDNDKNIIVGTIYKSPDTCCKEFLHMLDKCLDKIIAENKQIYLMGDFNFDLLNHATHKSTGDFLNIMFSHNLLPLIDKPTRITPHSATLLDNIFTNHVDNVFPSGILYYDISDHLPVFHLSNCNMKSHSTKNIRTRKINGPSIANFAYDLSQIDWSPVYDTENGDLAYNTFHDVISNLYNKHFPLSNSIMRKKNEVPRKPWITAGLLRSINKKQRLYRRFLLKPNAVNEKHYKTYCNVLTTIMRRCKRSYYTNVFQSHRNNLAKTWRTINEILGKSRNQPLPDHFNNHGIDITDPSDIADSFNEYFTTIGPKLANSIPHANSHHLHSCNSNISNSLFFIPTDPEEIQKVVAKLKLGSAGLDDLNPMVFKQVIHLLALPLSHIFNMSLQSGIVPGKLKIAKVIPIYKKDDPHKFSNYRPISVLPYFSKILERLVYNRLYNYLSRYSLLHNNQFGFRANHSTDMAITHLTQTVYDSLDKKIPTIGVFIDLSKAFDTINHDILLRKLSTYGIRGLTLTWFENYLNNRQQVVNFNSRLSSHLPITCGVPQGSILGPLLFLLYINDLSHVSSKLSFLLFADDTNIFFSHPDINSLVATMNTELDKVASFFHANKLSLNVDKTSFMLFTTRAMKNKLPAVLDVRIDNKLINQVSHTKFLGIIIDDKLSWADHLSYISSKVARSAGILSKLRYDLPSVILKSLYDTLVLPHLSYCNIAWGRAAASRLNPLFRLQKRAIRYITNADFRAHTGPLFANLKTLRLNDINDLCTAIFMFKAHKCLLPALFDNYFQYSATIHSHNTRRVNNFYPPRVRSNLAANSIKVHGVNIWNSIPISIQNATSTSSFKHHFKSNLLSQPVYQ